METPAGKRSVFPEWGRSPLLVSFNCIYNNTSERGLKIKRTKYSVFGSYFMTRRLNRLDKRKINDCLGNICSSSV